jgi:SAM-dependent methyltransferase
LSSSYHNDLNLQQLHWENHWNHNKKPLSPEPPSKAVIEAAKVFKAKGITKILELGGGLGRDTLYLAKLGLNVNVIEYSKDGVQSIIERAKAEGLSDSISVHQHDVRNPLPFGNGIFDGCFSHMLYCMAFTDVELAFLSQDIKRVLKPDGVNIYTVRNTHDPMYGTGIHKDGNMYEIQGFIINFFNESMIKTCSQGYQIEDISEIEEGELPKKLYKVTLTSKN